MDSFDKMFKKEHVGQNVLAVLFIVYLIMGYKTPEPVAGMIDTTLGKIVVVLVAVLLFAYADGSYLQNREASVPRSSYPA